MGIIDDLKFKRDAKRLCEECKISVKEKIVRCMKQMNENKKIVVKLKEWQVNGARDEEFFKKWFKPYIQAMVDNPKEIESFINKYLNEYITWKYIKIATEKQLSYIRENTRKDIQERDDVIKNFKQRILEIDPLNKLDLRFHATSLATTKDIIESGGLMSSVDRLDGYMQTTNLSNEISVSDINSIEESLMIWSDLDAYKQSLPAGCMFVVQPQSQEEADMIVGRQMHNVYFHKHPDRLTSIITTGEAKQLVAIVTTSENLPQLQQWLSKNELNKDIACTYGDFPQILESKKEQLIPPYDKSVLATFMEGKKIENDKNDLAGKILDGQPVVVETPDVNEMLQQPVQEDISL